MKPAFLALGVSLASIAGFIVFALPTTSYAAEAFSVQTRQILPPGQQSCVQLPVRDVTAYVYDGQLHSFDVTVADAAYVSVVGSAGGEALPFFFMTRRIDAAGNLRIHVDTDPTFGPVSLTLLKGADQRTCLAVVSFIPTSAGAGPITPIPQPQTPTTPYTPTTSSQGGSPTTPGGTGSPNGGTNAGGGGGSGATSGPVAGTDGGRFDALCADQGAYRLWFMLLAVFLIIAAFIGLAQPPLSERHWAIPVAAIGVPLVLLLGFWYLVPGCRAGIWVPIIALLAAAAGLIAAFRNDPLVTRVIELPPSKK